VRKARDLAIVDMRDAFIFHIAPLTWQLQYLQNKDIHAMLQQLIVYGGRAIPCGLVGSFPRVQTDSGNLDWPYSHQSLFGGKSTNNRNKQLKQINKQTIETNNRNK
jgi:hypothetical protein